MIGRSQAITACANPTKLFVIGIYQIRQKAEVGFALLGYDWGKYCSFVKKMVLIDLEVIAFIILIEII